MTLSKREPCTPCDATGILYAPHRGPSAFHPFAECHHCWGKGFTRPTTAELEEAAALAEAPAQAPMDDAGIDEFYLVVTSTTAKPKDYLAACAEAGITFYGAGL